MSKILGSEFLKEAAAKLKVNADKVRIENKVFLLFSKVTVAILFTCCGLVTLQELIGQHIECLAPDKEDLGKQTNLIPKYCFIMSTYTLPHLLNKTIGVEVAHPGVGQYNEDDEEHEPKYHAYYQWVAYILFFQALFFLLPHYVWKSFEGSRIKTYCNLEIADKIKMKHRRLLHDDEIESKDKKLNMAAEYFLGYLSYNGFYSYMYVLCEVLNFVIVVLNIYITDAFLGYEFSTYGLDVIKFLSKDPENRVDPMSVVFPKVTKCDFHKIGPSGNIINYDVMCVLAINILNEKIYTFLWFWFVILSIIGGLGIIYRILVLFLPIVRNRIIMTRALVDDRPALDFVVNKLSYSDWFVLKRLSDNFSRLRFGELCQSIQHAMTQERGKSPIIGTPPPMYTHNDTMKEKEMHDQEEPLI